jgi:hypothetical protein
VTENDWATVIAGLMALLGVPLGFALAQWGERRKARSEAAAIRALLRAEMAANVELTRSFWSEAIDKDSPRCIYRHPLSPAWDVFAYRKLPLWSRDVWHSQLPRLPEALTQRELIDVLEFYRWFTYIEQRHKDMRFPDPPVGTGKPNNEAREIWGAIEAEFRQRVEVDVPIKS